MRLWSIHPEHLDSKGIVACWREALLAREVLKGKTKGWRNHPQLDRFKGKSLKFINTYLYHLWLDSKARNYSFDKSKLKRPFTNEKIQINNGQLDYEFRLIKGRSKVRTPREFVRINKAKVRAHPVFEVVEGPIEKWEKSHLN